MGLFESNEKSRVTMNFAETIKLQFGKIKIPNIALYFSTFYPINYLPKNAWLPQFYFWIPVALAKICFYAISHKPCKNTSVLVGMILKVSEQSLHALSTGSVKDTIVRLLARLW